MVKWGIHEVKCREYAGSVTAQRVTAVFIFLRICLSDLKPREKAKSPRRACWWLMARLLWLHWQVVYGTGGGCSGGGGGGGGKQGEAAAGL